MDKWTESVIGTINQSLDGTREKDLRFFRIDELLRNIERVGKFSSSCADCKRLKTEIESTIPDIREAVEVPGKKRRELDRLISRLARHIMKAHQFYPPWHHNYLYSFYGMVIGSAIGALVMALLPGKKWEILAAGFAVGLISGQLIGGKKDREIRTNQKLM
ncbi:MAG TPA: hypothetical protein DCY35_00410 [Prolixibacteraceae bacterium]|nr:hypothetical protein [Prolixibacteraceae bacterium]